MSYRAMGSGPPSLWLSRRHVLREVECAVVGGGWVGLATAWWLARQGRQVLVVEAGSVAGRASGRNAGFLLTGSAQPLTRLAAAWGDEAALAFWQRTRENRELVRAELLDSGLVDCDFLPEGSWIAAHAEAEGEAASGAVAELRASAERLEREGFELRWVEGAELARVSGSQRLGGAFHQPRDGGLDPVRLARGLVAHGGFEVLAGAQVDSLEEDGGRIGLHTAAGVVLAERAVVALNAYAPTLIPQLAFDVRPVRGQILATETGERVLQGVWYVSDGFHYLRQLADGTVLMGGCRQHAMEEEVGYLETPTATVQQALEAYLEEYFPRLAGRPVRHRWAGIMAFTPDGLPAIGTVPHLPAALYAAGANGHGMSLGFVLGRYLARHLAGEDVGEFLPAPRPAKEAHHA